jgi:hypothetical protein
MEREFEIRESAIIFSASPWAFVISLISYLTIVDFGPGQFDAMLLMGAIMFIISMINSINLNMGWTSAGEK